MLAVQNKLAHYPMFYLTNYQLNDFWLADNIPAPLLDILAEVAGSALIPEAAGDWNNQSFDREYDNDYIDIPRFLIPM
jgi:hypothetical protein